MLEGFARMLRASDYPAGITPGALAARADVGGPRLALMRLSEMERTAELPMSTTFELPGLRVRDNLGVCYGLVVRSMGAVGGIAAGFKALRRGEVSQYTRLLEDSRRHAIDRLVENARLIGADAVVGVRFDSSEIGQQLTEIVAYGTAVTVESTV
jgi:uncharacterized protein YbjQ (UPF0145 family)